MPRKTTVTLEDLLRVKRAEQPPVEFWSQFEHGLRAKQLAAIVEPRPWWAPFIRVGSRLSRYQLPVGATAILAITLFTLRDYQPSSQRPGFEPSVDTASAPAESPVDGKTIAEDTVNAPASAVAVVAVAEPAPVAAAPRSRADQPSSVAASTVGTVSHLAMVNSELSSARIMADNLALAQPSDPTLDQMLGRSQSTSDNASIPSEPLAQINVPGKSAIYGVALPASVMSGDSALRVNEGMARHLTERRLSESDVVSRLAVGGDRLTVKF